MTSVRSKAILLALRTSKLFSTPITLDNLKSKREGVAKLAKFAVVNKDVSIKPYKTKDFKGEWIKVPESRDDKVLLYFHGGGFIFNFTPHHRDYISRLARTSRFKALSLDYSLAPENPYPVAVNEAMSAYKWLLESYKPQDIVVMGDSAGGAMTLSLLQMIKRDKLQMPACAIAIAPPTDATLESYKKYSKPNDYIIKDDNLDFFMDLYFKDTPRNDPIASPLFGDYKDLPPIMIHIDKSEVLYGDAVALVKKAKSAGVEA
ncbi:MAG TPA: alpha/beta hydrolase, partial [Candidatus Saccharibacteria bacterium]|nr:alpha/beta hydrolase [Candidatus Saccharibacteria bacterium]